MDYNISKMIEGLDFFGWRFYMCDASIVGRYSVMLMRNPEGRKWWSTLSEDEQEDIALYANGSGGCLGEALAKAIEEAAQAIGYEDWCTSQETQLSTQ